ncbi:MAG: phosphotransferase [Candidatus Accumulibacter sp. UW25]|jgi:hypothetical protein
MSESALDQCFGWRWLLPLGSTRSFGLYGFDSEEESFWEKVITVAGLVRKAGNAEVLLINADRTAEYGSLSTGEISTAQVICVIAGRQTAQRWRVDLAAQFPLLQEYSLMPAGGPRVVVPLDSWRQAVAGLCLHRPGRWVGRLGLLAASGLARIGNLVLLRKRVLILASRERHCVPQGAQRAGLFERYGGQETNYALYLGTPDDNRKTVVLPIGSSPLGVILKVAETPRARASLANEASALEALRQSAIASCVPKLAHMVASGDTLTLYQEYRLRRRAGKRRMGISVVEFLAQLSLIDRQPAPLLDHLETLPLAPFFDLPDEYALACSALHARLLVLADAGEKVWLNRTHGDFAPWNCAWTDRGFFVYDWEESRPLDLALGDAFSYVIAPARLLQRNVNVSQTLIATLGFADRVATAGGYTTAPDTHVYLVLWLLRRVHQPGLYGDLLVLLERNWR